MDGPGGLFILSDRLNSKKRRRLWFGTVRSRSGTPRLSVSPTLLSDSLCMLASEPPTTRELSPCLRKHGHQQLWAKRHSRVMIQKVRLSLEYQQSWKDSNWPSLDYLVTLRSIIVTTSMMMYMASVGGQGFWKHIIAKWEKQVFPEIGVLGGSKEIHCSPKNKLATPMLRWKEESFWADSLSKG